MMQSINHLLLLIIGVFSILSPLDRWLVAASVWWRPKSWTSNVRRSHHIINEQTTHTNSFDVLQLQSRSSLFGVANLQQRRRYLASIAATYSIRGGDSDGEEIDDA